MGPDRVPGPCFLGPADGLTLSTPSMARERGARNDTPAHRPAIQCCRAGTGV